MGDRANIVIRSDDATSEHNTLYLYTHWSGSELPKILAAALKRGKSRWDDEPYLNRIIFSEMIKDNPMGETGFGITPYVTDGDDRLLVVDFTDSAQRKGMPEVYVDGDGQRYSPQAFIDAVAADEVSWS